MDAYQLPIEDNSYDIAHAHQVLQHVSDPVALLREMKRVVRPGGIVAVRDADYQAMHWAPCFSLARPLAKRVPPDRRRLVDAVPIPLGRHGFRSHRRSRGCRPEKWCRLPD
ncbi:putative methyltransferase C1B3.06c [Nymphon striatum]|nr:putative methyltransferase C1B3.06c [Nymphon striatum]